MFVDSTTPRDTGQAPQPGGTRRRLARTATLGLTASLVIVGLEMTPALAADVNGGTLALDGTAKTATTTIADDNSYVSFSGTAGQRVILSTTASSYTTAPSISLLNPSAVAIGTWTGNGYLDTTTLPTTGTYKVYVDPSGTETGAITVQGYSVSADVAGGAMATDGTAKNLATAQGQNATATITATAGQRYLIQTTGSSYGIAPTVTVTNPSSTVLGTWSANGLLDTTTFASAGTYTIKVDPVGVSTGNINVKAWLVAADPTTALPTNGNLTTITTATGQNGLGTFTAAAGQRFMIETTGSTYGSDPAVSLIKPDGTTVVTNWSGNSLMDTTTLATAGMYTVKVDAPGTVSGSIGVRVWAVPADATTAMNINESTSTSATLSNTIGQNVAFTFSGTTGQRVQIQTSANTFPSSTPVSLLAPDGSTVANWTGGTTNYLLDTTALPQTGTYSLLVNPAGKNIGSIKAQIWNVPADTTPALPMNGTPVTMDTPFGGMKSIVSFNITVPGTKVQFATSDSTYTATPNITLFRPDGISDTVWSDNMAPRRFTFNTVGTWTVVVNPAARATGSLSITANQIPADVNGGALPQDGTPTVLTTTSAGQGSYVTIAATAGQRIQIKTSDNTYTTVPSVALVDPNGLWVDNWSGAAVRKTVTFAKTGTYQVHVYPVGKQTGSLTVQGWSVPDDVNGGALALDGTATTVTTVAGQGAYMTFTGTAGQRIMLQSLNGTYDSAASISLVNPAGNDVMNWSGDLLTGVITLKQSGTFSVVVSPRGRTAGSESIKAWIVPADVNQGEITVGGPAVVLENTAGGQNAFVTLTGSAGDEFTISTSNSSFSVQPSIELLRPNGNEIWSRSGEFDSRTITLPVSGTFQIMMDPQKRTVGSIKVKVLSVG